MILVSAMIETGMSEAHETRTCDRSHDDDDDDGLCLFPVHVRLIL